MHTKSFIPSFLCFFSQFLLFHLILQAFHIHLKQGESHKCAGYSHITGLKRNKLLSSEWPVSSFPHQEHRTLWHHSSCYTVAQSLLICLSLKCPRTNKATPLESFPSTCSSTSKSEAPKHSAARATSILLLKWASVGQL